MTKNGLKCMELGWECIPLAVKMTYMYSAEGPGNLQPYQQEVASSEAGVRQDMYGRLSLTGRMLRLSSQDPEASVTVRSAAEQYCKRPQVQ